MKSKLETLQMIHRSLSNGIRAGKSNEPRKWLSDKALSIDMTGACFNSGQMHHRREQEFLDELESVGFITISNAPTSTGKPGYKIFGKEAIIFPLKNNKDEVVNFYAIRISLEKQPHNYLNDDGIYPKHPPPLTRKLYITRTILDAASLLETRILDNRDAVMALHEGELKPQHLQAIEQLKYLEEILLIN